jgi:hypothetical protein
MDDGMDETDGMGHRRGEEEEEEQVKDGIVMGLWVVLLTSNRGFGDT